MEIPPLASESCPPPTLATSRDFWRPVIGGAVALLLLITWVWWDGRDDLRHLQSETARRLVDSETRLQEGRVLARVDHDTLQDLQNKIGGLEARLAETQSQSIALEAMYQDIVRGRDERLLSEIDQSITIAAQQLQLAGNVEAALIALQTADARLGSSAQARFLPIRRLIARDIERLKALPTADLSGLSLKIETVVAVVDTLPLAFEHRPEPPVTIQQSAPAPLAVPGALEKLGREIWQEVKHLVRIERIEHSDPALLAPSQTFFLRENLRLRLLSARLALLQRQSTTYRDDLHRVRELLERYFDVKARPVQTALATVAQLANTNPALDLPTLTETLSAVRNLKLPKEARR